MNSKIKKIIAREGLIILMLSILVIASLYLPSTYTVLDNDRGINLFEEQRLKITDTKDNATYTIIIKKPKDNNKYLESEILNELGRRGKLDSAKDLDIVKKEISLEPWKNILLIIALSFYPLYLVAMFILWAIKILRE